VLQLSGLKLRYLRAKPRHPVSPRVCSPELVDIPGVSEVTSPFKLWGNDAIIGFAIFTTVIMNIIIIWDMTADGLVEFTHNSEEIIAAIIRFEE
jgi:hypothetical protein